MCSYCLSFVYNSCVQNIGPGQYENQKVSWLNHDFCHFVVDFEEFIVGGRLECLKFNVLVLLSLTHVIANRLLQSIYVVL